jgi:hypothetical protein
MAQFTQLGLSGRPEKKSEVSNSQETSRIGSNNVARKSVQRKKTAMLAGSALAGALLGVFLLESGCSKSSDKVAAISAPASYSPPAVVPSTLPATPAVVAPTPKKKTRQHKLAASTYNNPTYGVSFRYPKHDSLKEGDKASLELEGLGPVEMNFVQPGGTPVSAVELPGKSFTGTDFNSAFFNVSVNSKVTQEECEQFAFPQGSETDPVAPSKAKVGATEFQTLEGFADENAKQADVKYYHVFQNGSCYEFALGLETNLEMPKVEGQTVYAMKPVNHNEVFRQLNWMLSTVKIMPPAVQEKASPEVAAEPSASPVVPPALPASAAVTEVH